MRQNKYLWSKGLIHFYNSHNMVYDIEIHVFFEEEMLESTYILQC